MSIWRTAAGDEIVICDDCGISEDGTRPDLGTMTKRSFEAVMMMPGHPASNVAIKVKDTCPDCQDKRPLRAASCPQGSRTEPQ